MFAAPPTGATTWSRRSRAAARPWTASPSRISWRLESASCRSVPPGAGPTSTVRRRASATPTSRERGPPRPQLSSQGSRRFGSSSGLGGEPGAGSGLVDAARAVAAVVSNQYGTTQINAPHAPARGSGGIESSRGSYHVYSDLNADNVPELVTGEVDALGNAWNA